MNKILAIPPGDLLRSVSDYVDAVCRHDADDSSPMNYAMRNFR